MKTISLVGKQFGRLTLLKRVGLNYECVCKCGKHITAYRGNLTSGNTTSCGCFRKEVSGKYRRTTDPKLRGIGRYYRRNAKTRNLSWELTQYRTETLLLGSCDYCNKKPSFGIDRINSKLGYTLGNVVSCCKRCNQAKNDMTLEEFKSWLCRVYNYFIKEQEAQ